VRFYFFPPRACFDLRVASPFVTLHTGLHIQHQPPSPLHALERGGRSMRLRVKMPLAASIIASFSLFATLELAVVSGASAELAPTGSASVEENLVVDVPEAPENLLPTSVAMSEGRAVSSMSMLMVSQMVEQVEKARTPKGARKIAQGIAKEKYRWGSYQWSSRNSSGASSGQDGDYFYRLAHQPSHTNSLGTSLHRCSLRNSLSGPREVQTL
jgi:hypothetical protein